MEEARLLLISLPLTYQFISNCCTKMPTESFIERCHFLFCQDLANFETKARFRGSVPGDTAGQEQKKYIKKIC